MNITRKTLAAALLSAVWLIGSAAAQDATPPKPRVAPPGKPAPAAGAQPAPAPSQGAPAQGAPAQGAPANKPAQPAAPAQPGAKSAAPAQSATTKPATTVETDPPTAGMQRWQSASTPGAAQKELERFIGKWSTETTVHGIGSPDIKSKGSAECRWLYAQRWVQLDCLGSFMGQAQRSLMTLGYDNFKQKYVSSTVDSVQTSMRTSAGNFEPARSTLITYGTIDEPISGECDKQVKYVWRFDDADTIHFEMHDLSVGETNTLVMDVVYTRKKGP